MRYAILLFLLCFTQPASAALYTFDYSQCRFNIPFSGTGISVGCVDMRESVRAGKHKPEYVGIVRGGYGNPWNVNTKGGKPFGDEVARCLEASLTAAGFEVAGNAIAYPDTDREALQKLKSQKASHKMLLVIHDWSSDNIQSFGKQWTDVYYKLEIIVLDANGRQIGKKILEGKSEAIGKKGNMIRAHIKDRKKIAPSELVFQMNILLADKNIAPCFNGGSKNSSTADSDDDNPLNNKDESDPSAPKPTAKTNSPSNTQNTTDELRSYKKLLDEGVITQDEYNAKKKKLLGL